MKCPVCGKIMKNIMHFEKDKNHAFHECPGCYVKTHKKRIHFEDIKNNDELKTNEHMKGNKHENKRFKQ